MMHEAGMGIEEVPYCFSMSSVKFQGHRTQKIANIDLIWAFPDCHSNLNLLMTTKWCIKLEETWERCPIVFQCHLSNFLVMGDNKMPVLTRFEHFRTVSPSQMHWWLWNDTQSWKGHGRRSLLFFKAIGLISRSHRPNQVTRPVAAIKSLGFALFMFLQKIQQVLCFTTTRLLQKCGEILWIALIFARC